MNSIFRRSIRYNLLPLLSRQVSAKFDTRTGLIFFMAVPSPAWVSPVPFRTGLRAMLTQHSRPWRVLSCSLARTVRNWCFHGPQCDLPLVGWKNRRSHQGGSDLRQVYALLSLIGPSTTDKDLVGKTLAFTSINFTNSKGEVFARGSHTKYVALAWKDPNNIVEELSPREGKKP